MLLKKMRLSVLTSKWKEENLEGLLNYIIFTLCCATQQVICYSHID